MMDMTHAYWEENSNMQSIKYERCNTNEDSVRIKGDRTIYPCCDSNLNFSTATCSEDDCEYGPYKKSKVARQDPMSHRIIEKRRRDRMNNCLADLSRLIPTEYLKKGRGRIEKTEIIEMAIKHMKHLQSEERSTPIDQYRLGYQECMSEAMRFMVEIEGHFPRESVCVRLLNHLQKHCEQLSKGHQSYSSSHDLEEQIPSIESFSVQVPTLLKNGIHNISTGKSKVREYGIPKAEPENSSSNDTQASAFAIRTLKADAFEKDTGSNGMSYKYKTSIKLRFNQDLSAHEVPKRQKLDDDRRHSITSFENQSSNHSSPPSSEPRMSENENTILPTHSDNATENNDQHELNMPRMNGGQEFPSSPKAQSSDNNNFNVPIFALHAKGAYYVPLTIDYKTLLPYLQNYNNLDVPTIPNIVLHPVTINVNFLPNFSGAGFKSNKYQYEFNNNWH